MAANKTKMPSASTDEQFKFLISCIRYSNNGKVDFTEVANECNIVSKGAAAKRYERMMKQHGLHQGGGSSRDAPTSPVAKEPKPAKTTPVSKKRKAAAMDGIADMNPDDDERVHSDIKAEHGIKVESDVIVKDEPDTVVEPAPTLAATMQHENAEEGHEVTPPADERMFNEFLQTNAFEHQNESAHGGYDGAYEPKGYADAGATQESILID